MMRFLLGVVLGFGVGFAGSVLFAPEKTKEADWVPGQPQASKNGSGGILDTVKERVTQAMSEAKDARKQAEREMRDRYERTVNRKSS
jgi:gas vesicle protein